MIIIHCLFAVFYILGNLKSYILYFCQLDRLLNSIGLNSNIFLFAMLCTSPSYYTVVYILQPILFKSVLKAYSSNKVLLVIYVVLSYMLK